MPSNAGSGTQIGCPPRDNDDHSSESVLFIGTQFSNLYTAVDTQLSRVMCMMCVFGCKCVLGSPGNSQPLNTFACLSLRRSVYFASCRLRLAVGATPFFIGSSAPPLPCLTAAQRVHPPHSPSSLRPPLYTSNTTQEPEAGGNVEMCLHVLPKLN